MSESKFSKNLRKRIKIAKAERDSAQSRMNHLQRLLDDELREEED